MPSSRPEPLSMEDRHIEEGPVAPSGPAAAAPSPPTTAISMASNDESARPLRSPAEASPAKPAVASPTASGSHVASAAADDALPRTLTRKGVSVTLENDRVWKQFHKCGTEMILSKPGRRMFPYCRYRVAGLKPNHQYGMCLSFVLSDKYKYRWSSHGWEVAGLAEDQPPVPPRTFLHLSICGSVLMSTLLSFYRLKLTNSVKSYDGHITLNTMNRYVPQLHIIPVGDDGTPSRVESPDTLTFTFPQTEFTTVTSYQNFRITQLKINHNPFAKSFREDRIKSRLSDGPVEPVASDGPVEPVASNTESSEEELESKSVEQRPQGADWASPTHEQESNLELEPISKPPAAIQEAVPQSEPCKKALKAVVVVPKRSWKTDDANDADESASKRRQIETPKESSPDSTLPAQKTLHRHPSKRRGHWNRFENGWKSATPCRDTSAVGTEPEIDEVEGLTFVSFDTKEAMESHMGALPAYTTSTPGSPDSCFTTSVRPVESEEATARETDEEKITRLEAVLLRDLKLLKYRQVIHPVLREVGLRLNSLDPSQPIDLRYLGIRLPLSPLNLPEPPHDREGLTFISRTGKTSDITKIKGWKSKFFQSQQPNDASPRNMSAFCSNMLDEYLENEARHISERVATFPACPESAVAYELPAKSASYVKTLDSALQHRKSSGANNRKPHPPSFKPLLYAVLTSPAPQLPSPSAISNQQRLKTVQLKVQQQLLEMEDNVVSHGCIRTQLSPYRLSTSLAAMWTNEMPQHPIQESISIRKVAEPECSQDYCRLGCLCVSLLNLKIATDHCRKPGCIFDCSCSKGTNKQIKPYPIFHLSKLWNRNMLDVDPEPLFLPKNHNSPANPPPHKSHRTPLTHPIREEDKDPVYKYLESFLTCARVRAFNSKPPDHDPPNFLNTLGAPSKPQGPRQRAKRPSSPVAEPVPVPKQMLPRPIKKQIEIQSVCNWKEDRAMVLENLCTRLNQDNMSEPFNIGPYCIHPVTKIFIKKPAGSNLVYRVRISRLAKPSNSAVEKSAVKDARELVEEDAEEPGRRPQVKPFLSGVLPTGLMIARTKPLDCETSELIQVNGKTYSNVNLLLGSMGSLHPANRLAAYATGRLIPRADLTRRMSRAAPSTSAASTPAPPAAAPTTAATQKVELAKAVPQNLKVTSQLLPLMMSAKNTSDIKSHPLFQLLKQPSVKKEPESPTWNQTPLLAAIDLSQRPPQPGVKREDEIPTSPLLPPLASINLFQRPDRSPVSLTVSSSLKTPSFLTDTGTYSFRICPPSNSAVKDRKRPAVTLPGGFTLLRIPKQEDEKEPKVEAAPDGDAPAAVDESRAVKEEAPSWAEDSDDSSLDYSGDYDSDAEFNVDIETIEDSKDGTGGERRKRSAQTKGASASQRTGAPDYKTRRRKNHSVIEKQRRFEQRVLFDSLQETLGHKAGSKLHVLSLAMREVHMLRAISGALVEKKEHLIQDQAFYIKKLSSLSGKPENLIKRNLNILFSCLKEKGSLKGEPLLLGLCQPKSAEAQETPTTKPPPAPSAPSHQATVPPTLPPTAIPPHSAQNHAPEPAPRAHAAPSGPATPFPEDPAVIPVPTANEALPQFTVPLIRSKTGRLILPSSMKPAGQGFYTLMLMNASKNAAIAARPPNGAAPPELAAPPDKPKVPEPPSPDSSPPRKTRGRPRKGAKVSKEKAKKNEDKTFNLRITGLAVKRGRGRPRKNDSLGEDGGGGGAAPVRPCQNDSPEEDGAAPVRPRTRGSLGKDFPSAKRQSWIDMEMALDPDSKSDSDSE
ncbi:MAX gene-associated protein [Stigmatopora argus]